MFRPALVVLIIGGLAASQGAFAKLEACSCTNERTLAQEFESAAAVFTGRVTAVQPAGDGFNVIVSLTPLLRWKGGLSVPLTLATPENSGICGYAFEIGREYLVFAWPYTISGQQTIFTHLCSRTGSAEGNPDITNLGPPLVPTAVRAISWGSVKRVWR
jgi:hypothetical protein